MGACTAHVRLSPEADFGCPPSRTVVSVGTIPCSSLRGRPGADMKRREFITLLSGAVVAWPLTARAQQPKKIPRLCFLTFDPGTLQSRSPRFDAFFEGLCSSRPVRRAWCLRDLGYVNGQTITIDYLSANGQSERFASLAAECVRLKADIIAVSTTPAAQAAKNTTHTIPIVMIALGDPVGTGLVKNLARPGGNLTGMSMIALTCTNLMKLGTGQEGLACPS